MAIQERGEVLLGKARGFGMLNSGFCLLMRGVPVGANLGCNRRCLPLVTWQ